MLSVHGSKKTNDESVDEVIGGARIHVENPLRDMTRMKETRDG